MKRLTQEEFDYIFKKVPRLCVDLIIKNSDGVLLTLRNIPPAVGFWHLPGGTVLQGEKLTDAVDRIAKVELGVGVEIIKQLGVIEYITNQSSHGHVLSVAFLVKLESDEIKLDRQASQVEFFKEIPENTIEEVKLFLKNL